MEEAYAPLYRQLEEEKRIHLRRIEADERLALEPLEKSLAELKKLHAEIVAVLESGGKLAL
ncbi:hypothetical protein [Desulfothermobacter acidiphilus]|uniref:hypothetical protein n=1 Tax=Desulfothermobacter acidiphilus TaxID=1938353 RepID=UPI003F8CEF03